MRRLLALLPLVALSVLLGAALLFTGEAETEHSRLSAWAPWLLVLAIAAALLLAGLVGWRLLRLWRARRAATPGARLEVRLALALVVLALPPLLLVYAFALRFLTVSVDSWFDVRIEQALGDARSLGRLYLGDAERRREQDTRAFADALSALPDAARAAELGAALDRLGALRLSLFGPGGAVLAHASADVRLALPDAPDGAELARLAQSGTLLAPLPLGDGVAVRVLAQVGPARSAVLDASYALPPEAAPLMRALEQSLSDYARLEYLHQALKWSFVLILTLVLLLTALMALLAALAVARRAVAPVAALAGAAGEIAAGRLGAEVRHAADDELGFLVQAFNRMSRELSEADARLRQSQADTERQRLYLETVLGRLSSGVLGFDGTGRLRTVNHAAEQILREPLSELLAEPLAHVGTRHPELAPLCAHLAVRASEQAREWREEVRLERGGAPQVLLVRGARLPSSDAEPAGFVAVFDDATELNQANREAAWSEVARRLAHEIKNPLTPIQLAAERLERKLGPRLVGEDQDLLRRTSRTIVAQVDTMKQLVNAFGDYARPPRLELRPLDLNRVLDEVLDLYEGEQGLEVRRVLSGDLPPLRADAGRIRQLLHNLIRNALEAMPEGGAPRIEVATRRGTSVGTAMELELRDNGPGLPPDFDASWFEPYTTTKPKGGGLGLAIVKKIAEEHGATVSARNRAEGGAEFVLRFPA
jgi:nitrogen fixation/metabolism regulation signal transduction histidine kinase